MEHSEVQEMRKNRDTTRKWAVGIIITISIWCIGILWKASALVEQVKQNTEDITRQGKEIDELKNGVSIIITRDQLDDILLVRDTRLDNFEKSMGKIEAKLDRILNEL